VKKIYLKNSLAYCNIVVVKSEVVGLAPALKTRFEKIPTDQGCQIFLDTTYQNRKKFTI
jgi:hypothetical protein